MLAVSHRGGIGLMYSLMILLCHGKLAGAINDFRLLLVVAPILLPAEITAPTEYRVVELRSTC